MLLWQLSWLAAWCLGVRASEARLSRQTDRGGGNLIAQPSPTLMSVYPAIYPCVYLSVGHCLSAWRILLWLLNSSALFPKVSFECCKHTNFLERIRTATYESPTVQYVAAGLTPARFPLSVQLAHSYKSRIMSRHVWRARDETTKRVCIWCGGRKLFYNEEGCQDMKWEAGSWRQDITYEKETNVRKCSSCCCWLYELKCIVVVSAMINTAQPGQNPARTPRMPPTLSLLFLGLQWARVVCERERVCEGVNKCWIKRRTRHSHSLRVAH